MFFEDQAPNLPNRVPFFEEMIPRQLPSTCEQKALGHSNGMMRSSLTAGLDRFELAPLRIFPSADVNKSMSEMECVDQL